MAAKVNTRFILGLVLAVGAALVVFGGVYVLKLRGDATRNFRKGEELFAKADYKSAYDQFGRALAKEPGNPQYLQRMSEALHRIVPQTANEASEYFSRSIATLGHAAVHNPKDVDAHLRLLSTLTDAARRSNDVRSWESVIAAADSMHQQIEEGNPSKPLARVYRAMAVARLVTTRSDEEIASTLEQLQQAAATLGDNDLARAVEIAAKASWIQKLETMGRTQTTLDTEREELTHIARRAIERAPNGPETARAYLLYLAVTKSANNASVSDEDVRSAIEHVANVVTAQSSHALILETVTLLQAMPYDGRAKAKALLRNAVDAHPQSYEFRARLARMELESDELDRAEQLAQSILDADRLPVSYMARLLFGLRMEAAAMLGDIAHRRFELAAPADRPARLAEMSAAREKLASISANPGTDPLVTRADAKIAFVNEDFVTASQKFEELVSVTNGRDPEILAFASASLQRIGQIGAAHERISQAVAINPMAFGWLITKANLELRMAQPESAIRTVGQIPDEALASDTLLQSVNAIKRAAASAIGAGGTQAIEIPELGDEDPIQTAMETAQEALEKNEHETARAVLLAVLDDHPESIRLLHGLAVIELRAGNREAAGGYVDRALALRPNEPTLNQFAAALRHEDPIVATVEYHKTMIEDEAERLAAIIVSMSNVSAQQQQRAAQLRAQNDGAGATAASDLGARADAEAERSAQALAALDPDNASLIEYRFGRALASRDFAGASVYAQAAKRLNTDAAGGLLFEGRLHLAQRNYSAAITSLESATDRLSFSAYAWRTLAIAYQQAGNFAEAERAYERAYRCNPNDINGARAYLTLLQQRGDLPRALTILQTIHRLVPNDPTIREAWLDLEARVGDIAVALNHRVELYRKDPKDMDNAAALALLLASLDPSPETLLDEDGQPRFSAQRWAAMSSSERDEAVRTAIIRWNRTADEIMRQLETDMGDTLRLAILRAALARERGNPMAGERFLREFIARRPVEEQSENMYMAMAQHYSATERFGDAIDALRQAVALGGPRQRDARIHLAQLLMQVQQHAEALEMLQAAQAQEDTQSTRLQIIECLLNMNRLDDADRMLAESASSESGSVVTLLKATIASRRGHAAIAARDADAAERAFAQQRDLLARAEQQDPTNPMPRILLAQSLVDEYNRTKRLALLDDAMTALDRAEVIRPGFSQISSLRVAIQRERGELSSAITVLQRTLANNPGDASARRQLVYLLVETGAFPQAIEAIDEALRINPTIAIWHELKGDLIGQRGGDIRAVVTAYAAAYQHAPTSPMLRKLTGAILLMNPPDCNGVIALMQARSGPGDVLETDPALRDHYARALACAGRKADAIEQLKLSYRLHRSLIESAAARPSQFTSWFVALAMIFPGEQAAEGEQLLNELSQGRLASYELNGLARLWIASGPAGASKAIELARQAVAVCPADQLEMLAQFNADLGDLLVGNGDLRGASEAYEAAVRANPQAWNAVNNLAFLKAEMLGDAAGALPLAERLAEGASDQGSVLDTVGWVYYKNGDLENARRYLRQSVAILPAAETYIHLAEVLWRSGDATEAEKQLQEAEKLNPSADSQQKIRTLRDDMRKN